MHTSQKLNVSRSPIKRNQVSGSDMGLNDYASSVGGDDASVATSGRFGTQYSSDSDFELEEEAAGGQGGGNMWNSWGPLKAVTGILSKYIS